MPFIDVAKLRAGNQAYLAKVEAAIPEAARTAGQLALIRLRSNPPFKSRTGKLLAATDFIVRSSKSGALLKFESKVPYASFLEKGTKPHLIKVKNASALRFYWEKIGQDVAFNSVMHPGTKALHFLENTRDFAASLFLTELHKRL